MNKSSNGAQDFFAKIFYIKQWKKNKNKRPSKKQWLSFFKIISKTEKIIFFIFLFLAIGSLALWWWLSILENTKIQPADGGILKEVIMGQPQSLNPIFSLLNDADRDVSELIFSGLLKYTKDGKLINNLAKEYNLSKDGKIYEFKLKDNLLWSDGEKITTEDISFTIEAIKNPEVQSPLRLVWQDVKIEKADEKTIKFILKNPYFPFLENFTLKILPSHLFKDIESQEILSKPQDKTASSGPFKIKTIEKEEDRIKKIILDKNPNFHGKPLFLDGIELIFARDELEFSELKNQATNIPNISPKDKNNLEESFEIYNLSLPRYFALFLNQENKILSQKEIRESLAMATPKEEIINQVLAGKGRIIEGPLLEENQIGGELKKYKFDIEAAKKKLDKAGWKDGNKDGIREKVIKEKEKATPLELNLFTVDQAELKETAKIIQKKWEEIGVKLNINTIEGEKLRQDYIAERKYDILLFAQGLYMIADPSSFWHSSQKDYPGSNLSMYQNSDIDAILKKSITETDFEKRKKLLQSFQKKITKDIPAIFLYSPNYIYAVDKKVKGIDGKYIIDPSKRFIGIENWYTKEKRVPK